jgi:hypothetical protein
MVARTPYAAELPDVGLTPAQIQRRAYDTARRLGASDKVILALFEAGAVESDWRNSPVATDHDSVGFLQQRPSQGWGTVGQILNVDYATTSFVRRAMANEPQFSTSTAGALAQSVQRSAYPGRYDQAETAARTALARLAGGAPTDPPSADPAGLLPSPPSAAAARNLLIEALAAGLGIGLLMLGAVRLVGPTVWRARSDVLAEKDRLRSAALMAAV